jgi:ribosome biogenesis GTPase
MEGRILSGSNNVFAVAARDGSLLECRIKGKILRSGEERYNALAPGDMVEIELDPQEGTRKGLIAALKPRRNSFCRYNEKGRAFQTLAANIDLAVCVASPVEPPFRPRFLDRFLVMASFFEVPAMILVNKSELGLDADIEERLEDYARVGYEVLRCSARTGLGLGELRARLSGKASVFGGQSGVGKSTLLNALAPGAGLATGDICKKWERGRHTTTRASLVPLPIEGGGWIVDTPGVRRFSLRGIPPEDLALHMPEFAGLIGACSYGLSCSHVSEPGCKILEAVHAGAIHEDRYESFLRMREELADER